MPLINPVQESILKSFPSAADSNSFYLTGGTALAHFYLHHRQSNDLDFFTATEELVDPFSRRLEQALQSSGMRVRRQRGVRSFVELQVSQQSLTTLIHLAQDAAFRFEPTREFPNYPGLQVDSLTDIASNKLLALYGRATLRDFIDIYALIQKKRFTQQELMIKAKDKDPGFDAYWLGIAFERINTFQTDSPDMLLLSEPIRFEELRSFFNQWRKQIADTLAT